MRVIERLCEFDLKRWTGASLIIFYLVFAFQKPVKNFIQYNTGTLNTIFFASLGYLHLTLLLMSVGTYLNNFLIDVFTILR